jgi:hypothetical protein
VSPHELLQAIQDASGKKFKIGVQSDPLDFLQWFLNTLHIDLGGTKKVTHYSCIVCFISFIVCFISFIVCFISSIMLFVFLSNLFCVLFIFYWFLFIIIIFHIYLHQKPNSSIIYEVFQGEVQVTTETPVKKEKDGKSEPGM